jgi:hypothetical protein
MINGNSVLLCLEHLLIYHNQYQIIKKKTDYVQKVQKTVSTVMFIDLVTTKIIHVSRISKFYLYVSTGILCDYK